MGEKPEITLFHYPQSPYARRVVCYLNLRGLSYQQCIQPRVMPRPDLAALGVQYRRIPLLSIGKDVYCDTRLILQKLEELFPDGALGSTDSEAKGLEKLLEIWTTDGGVFARAAQLIPPDVISDPAFKKDREELTGRSWQKESMLQARPEATAHMKKAFDLVETTFLADGREWIAKTKQPSLADVHAIWAFDWTEGLPGALDRDQISEKQYPKVFAWISRFREKVAASRSSAPKVSGADVLESLRTADYGEPERGVDENDPLQLRREQETAVWPIDSGSAHRDRGTLVGLDVQEVVLQRKTADQRFDVRIHFPRTNFRIVKAGDSRL